MFNFVMPYLMGYRYFADKRPTKRNEVVLLGHPERKVNDAFVPLSFILESVDLVALACSH